MPRMPWASGDPLFLVETLESRMLLSAGDLDVSFAGNGKAAMTLGDATITVRDVAMQSDGKMVVVGKGPDDRFAVARLNVDGSPDTSFGPSESGLVLTQLDSKFGCDASAVALYPTGEIVVVGSTLAGKPRLAVAKYLSNGQLDNSFSGNGKWASDLGEYYAQGSDVAIQNDGRIVIAGSVVTSFLLNPEDSDFSIVRLLANGDYDPTFGGGDGRRFAGFGREEYANAVAIDYTGTAKNNPYYGTIVVAGYQQATINSQNTKFAVARLKPTGSFDGRFNDDGRVTFQFPGVRSSEANGLVIQPKSKVVAVGFAGKDDVRTTNDFAMVRFGAFGAVDENFGGGGTGYVITDFKNGNDRANDVISAYNDRLIVGGTSGGKFALAAFDNQGLVQRNFGEDGQVLTGFNDGAGIAALARGPGNRRFVAGGSKFAARYLDVGANEISINTLDPTAYEAGVNPASFIVSRVERLPTPVTVGFSVGGTARSPGDYTSPNIHRPVVVEGATAASAAMMGPFLALPPGVDPGGGIPMVGSVTIPANETYAVVTITPVDDSLVEGNETIILALNDGADYDLGDRNTLTLDLIDDETTTVLPLADALVKQGKNADQNFGDVRSLQSRNKTSNNRRSYLKFSLLGLKGSRPITSIKLRLFGGLSGPSDPLTAGIYGVADTTWDESTITWNNKPPNVNPVLATSIISGQSPRYYEWDLTTLLKSDIDGGYDAVTLLLRNVTASDEFATFNSREAVSNPPQLVVTYGS